MAEIEQNTVSGPGKLLANARTDAGFNQQEVAQKLHLNITVIQCLEADQYKKDIPDAFARGYLRNYAKLLEIDEQEVIALYSQLIGSSKVKNYYEPSADVPPASHSTHKVNQLLPWLGFVIFAVIIMIWFLSQSSQDDTDAIADNVLQQNLLAEAVDTKSANGNGLDLNLSQTESNTVETTSPNVVAAEVPRGFVDISEAQLEFTFDGDCWVQVTDANGEVLAIGTKTAGYKFTVSGIAPIDVVLGKPREVNISYNQAPVDLSCFPASSKASFQLTDAEACGN